MTRRESPESTLMVEISKNQGFGLLQAYCRRRTEVRLKGYLGGEHAESNATIVEASPDAGEVCFRLFEESHGPRWLCKISLAGASFSFGHFVESEAPQSLFQLVALAAH